MGIEDETAAIKTGRMSRRGGTLPRPRVPRPGSLSALSPELIEKLKRAIYLTYNNVAGDGFGRTEEGYERIPGKAEFVSVIGDLLMTQAGPHSGASKHDILTSEEVEAFYNLSASARRRLILEVGP